MKVEDVDLSIGDTLDSSNRSHESSIALRRTHRKIETRVLFSDVMAQEREMERLNYEKLHHHHSMSPTLTQLRKGETVNSSGKSSKHKRAEERRSKRQKLRRILSPHSPDGGPQLPLRGGVSLVKLEEKYVSSQSDYHTYPRIDAIQDATLHSTAWRNLKFNEAPVNLLPDRDGILEPFALFFDAPLDEFDDRLKERCALSAEFLKPKPLTMVSGTRGEAKDELQEEDSVKRLIEEATVLVETCHAARTDKIIANVRQQIKTYIEQRPVFREMACKLVGFPLHISRLEKIASQVLLREAKLAPDNSYHFNYFITMSNRGLTRLIYPAMVKILSKITPIPRSTTCMLSRGTHRIDDDPIIRFVPHFSPDSVKGPQTPTVGSSHITLAGMDNEVNEYILRYNCRNHGRDQPVSLVRVDPHYPPVKTAANLWRRLEDEQLANEEFQCEIDNEMHDEQLPESDDKIYKVTRPAESSDKEGQPRTLPQVVKGNSKRRSIRARTAASTKASSKLRDERLKKMARFKSSDVSEYLGLDRVYQLLIQERKLELLSADIRCGDHCSNNVFHTTFDGKTNDPSNMINRPWNGSEVALLRHLKRSIGFNPCVLSALIATRDCSEVAEVLQGENETAFGLQEQCLQRNNLYKRSYERSSGVLGNSFEHLQRTRTQRMKDRGANREYIPCNHEGGSCDSAQCSCMRRDHYCEKSCGCSLDCSNRFTGCHCGVGQCRTTECPCYYAARECDPDICISCGASELPIIVADENYKGNAVSQLKICGNVNIMRGQMCKIGISASKTHGWGAFALKNIKMGEYIYEYTGSLLTQDEAERRGNVYDKTTISFLFDLTEDSVVDATRKGNKSKFANHDSNDPKCFARIMLVNGDHRIGIYAKQDINAGDELFFDYGYSGVIPDWSQARIGSSKETASVKQDDNNGVDEKGARF
ncbi:Transcriptional repressor EZH1 [Plasmopara halstedii]|uniref:Transcriptional repressor EZH1 n=1 Tax=Plasmopara halstedii TaxID=4781 RepID=A0A0P1AKU7_PLAHL|nr:Transcriptional repressor EZH1 [Plasmopara halstedii]CEG41674.1 Transcriptional repressor EZH1 [Plasmopara halstedii]|eukprot:XP_024578043.1 Transcriptional repressor EZH1 [Plasmopara halstedii]